MQNIVLVGFMGTGKTAIGKRIAKRLNMRFVNTDDIIEERQKRTIAEIFEESGEPCFRKIEKEVVKDVSDMDDVVVAAGGGVVLDEENVKNLKEKGVVVCLGATPSVIYERTKKYKHRPLLNVEDPVKKIHELLEYRAPFYARADHQVDTSDLTIEQVVDRVLEIINRKR